jgi:DNA-binding MarR family transcriptional regulator
MKANRLRIVNTPLNYMWRKRVLIREDTERFLKDFHLSETASDIYFYIAANDASVTSILSHPYFKYISLSTVKRAVSQLKIKNLITVTTDPQDRRIKWFNINEEN